MYQNNLKGKLMGNNRFKKEQALIHNEKRALVLKNKVNLKEGKLKPRISRQVQSFITCVAAFASPKPMVTRKTKVSIKPVRPDFKEPAKLIGNWVELSEVPCNKEYWLDITPKEGNGWIINKEGNGIMYLSTHTFYGHNHEYSTRILQTYGFNVELKNWDRQ
jgi:hypothetical protein